MRVRPVFVFGLFFLGATAAMAQEREWSIDQTDKEAYLVFGVPETDDVGVSFWCKLQSDIVRFYAPETDAKLKITDRVPFVLEIPPKSFRLRGKTSANEEAGSISLEAELKITDPVFAALQAADHFGVNVGRSKHMYPLQDADLSGFLRACKIP
jgi:hypothetical protein